MTFTVNNDIITLIFFFKEVIMGNLIRDQIIDIRNIKEEQLKTLVTVLRENNESVSPFIDNLISQNSNPFSFMFYSKILNLWIVESIGGVKANITTYEFIETYQIEEPPELPCIKTNIIDIKEASEELKLSILEVLEENDQVISNITKTVLTSCSILDNLFFNEDSEVWSGNYDETVVATIPATDFVEKYSKEKK